MKKISLFLLLFLVGFSNVTGKVYYSNYGDYSSYSEEPVDESDVVSVESTKTNYFYKEIITGDYFIEGENPFEYPNKSEKFITKEETDLQEIPEEKTGRVISTKNKFHFKDLLPVRYIRLSNLSGFEEIVIKNKGENIFYDITYNIDNTILIDMRNYFKIEDLAFLVQAQEFYFEIFHNLNEKAFFIGTFKDYDQDIDHTSLQLKDPIYGEEYILDEFKPRSKYFQQHVETTYSYVDTYYYYYNTVLERGPYYEETEEYPIKGEEITLYRYKTRDKISIMDNIVITDDNDIKLNDIIVESSAPYKIVSNLDTAVNGEYAASIITDFKTIKVKIIVDKKSNLLNALVKEMELNEELKDEVNQLNTVINNNYADMKDLINNTNEETDSLKNQLETEKVKYTELKNSKTDLEQVVVDKKINKQVFIPLCFIIVGLIGLYFYLKMSNDKNS